jgi:hypothetical protein
VTSESTTGRSARMTVRSYRPVFRLEKRWYTLDRWRIPWAYGVPQRAVGYFGAVLAGALLVNAATGGALATGDLRLDAILLAGAPAALAGLGFAYRPDGRDLPDAARAWLRWRLAPRRLVYLRGRATRPVAAIVSEVVFVPDAAGHRYRRARVHGPGRVRLRYPIALHASRRGGRLEGVARPGGPLRARARSALALERGGRLEIR